jgi:hypothetical protein
LDIVIKLAAAGEEHIWQWPLSNGWPHFAAALQP